MTLNFWSSYLLHAGITNLSHHDRFMLGGTDSRALRKQGKGSTTELHLQSFVLFLSFRPGNGTQGLSHAGQALYL